VKYFAIVDVLHQQFNYAKLGLLLVGFAIMTVAKNVA
jgi:hypothetical protein